MASGRKVLRVPISNLLGDISTAFGGEASQPRTKTFKAAQSQQTFTQYGFPQFPIRTEKISLGFRRSKYPSHKLIQHLHNVPFTLNCLKILRQAHHIIISNKFRFRLYFLSGSSILISWGAFMINIQDYQKKLKYV